MSKRTFGVLASLLLVCAAGAAGVQAAAPVAEDDFYETAAGDNLSVDAPGVLDNDSDGDGDPLTAVLVSDPVSGGVVNLFSDGSFEYEPPAAFLGTDSFTYQAYDGAELSNVATVSVTVTGTPQFAVYLDETAFLNDLAALGLDATQESYEDDAVWGSVRSSVSGGNFTAPAVTSMGIRWTANNAISEVTTGSGPARTGAWGFFTLPHGDYATGVDCHLPGNCTDGFIGTASPTLYAVGGWINAIFGSKIEIILDGSRLADFGDDAGVGSAHKFFGVIDPGGFHSFEIHELEGTIDDAKYIWADDFTIGTVAGITLSAMPGPGPFEVTLQWLGGQGGFSVYRSTDPATVLDSGNELGQTAGRVWTDLPPPGSIHYYRVTSP